MDYVIIDKDIEKNEEGEICMIDEEKVKLMHRAAVFAEKERENIYINDFYKKDYINLHVLLTVLRVFLALILIVALLLWCDTEMIQTFDMETISAGLLLFMIVSVVVISIYIIIAGHLYLKRYDIAAEKTREWKKILKQLSEKEQQEHS